MFLQVVYKDANISYFMLRCCYKLHMMMLLQVTSCEDVSTSCILRYEYKLLHVKMLLKVTYEDVITSYFMCYFQQVVYKDGNISYFM